MRDNTSQHHLPPLLWALAFFIIITQTGQLILTTSKWSSLLSLLSLLGVVTFLATTIKYRLILAKTVGPAPKNSLQNTLENSPLSYHILSPTGQITYCNDIFVRLVDAQSKAECIGKMAEAFIPDNKHAEFQQRLLALKLKQEHSINNYATGTLRRLSGQPISISHFVIPEYDDNRQLTQIHVLLLDIKDQVDNRILKNHFETFFGNLPAITFIHDNEGELTHVNEEALNLLKSSKEEIINRNYHDILPKEMALKYQFATNFVTQTRQSKRSTQSLYFDEEKKNRTYDMTMVPLLNEAKKVTAIATIAFDITHHKEMEEQLFHKTKQFRLALQDQGVFYWAYNSTTELLCFDSEHFSSQVKSKKSLQQNFTLKEYLVFTHPEDRTLVRNAFLAFFNRQSDFFSIEHRLITHDDQTLWIRALGEPVEHDTAGRATKLIGMSINITKLKITQQHLEEAKQKALNASIAKSEFLSYMNHEIRTPLNVIVGISHLFEQNPLSAKSHLYIEKLKTASELLMGIVNDTLDHAKIEANKLELSPKTFSLSALIRDAIEGTIIQGTKQIDTTITTSSTEEDLFIGDSQRISQILVNLLSNAFKFTPDGGKIDLSVEIKEVKDDQQTKELLFTLQDTGIGFDHATQDTLFQTFTQADSSITNRYGGTGLGLSIAKNLTELMGGKIGCSSRLGKGSTFWFSLCLAPSSEYIKSVAASTTSLVGKKILIVEDNTLNQFMTCELLEQEGMEVSIAHNGQKAIDTITKKPKKFDLVLMDIQMPIIDGYLATEHIRKTHPKELLPILAISANNSPQEREKCLLAGMNDFVSKPISPEFLITKIGTWVQ